MFDDNNWITHYLTIQEAADIFGRSERTIYRWLSNGAMPRFKFGSLLLISRKDLEEFIMSNTGYANCNETVND